jgi:Cu2+-containing amine oxidase
MGHITKKILNDVGKDPNYNKLTIEDNSNGMVHIHLKNIRLDLDHDSYNKLYNQIAGSIDEIRRKT